MNGSHGQIVRQHVVKESKQGQEHVRMMLKTLASHSLSKKVAAFRLSIGSRGPIVQQHVIAASKQELEDVLIILQLLPINQKLSKKLARFKTAVVIGDHGQVVQKHAVKEPKQGQKHASVVERLTRRSAIFQQLIGGHGQDAPQHVVKVARQELELVLTILQV